MKHIKIQLDIENDDTSLQIIDNIYEEYIKELKKAIDIDYMIKHSIIYNIHKDSGDYKIRVDDVILTIDEYTALKNKADLLDKIRKLDKEDG